LETDSEIWIGFPNGIGPSDKNQKEKKRKNPVAMINILHKI
jgi:hypothetical protein